MSEYSWSEADAANRQRLSDMAAAMDPGTVEHLETIGVGPGWRCAEIGAGVGTIARWLHERVGPSGHVLATDLDTRWLTNLSSSGVEVRSGDIAIEAPIAGFFDLVHARNVLTHVREWRRAIDHMLAALRPGGWILLEEPDMSSTLGFSFPQEPTVGKFAHGLGVMIENGGGDPDFGRRLPRLIRDIGLIEVGHRPRLAHGSQETMLSQVEAAGNILVSLGIMKTAELGTLRTFMENPANLFYGAVFVAAWGCKPV